ncbi:MAG: DUF1667 domain-containing protein [Spirochaetales bacterium]
MLKEYTCIMCPRGCDIEANIEDDLRLVSTEGAGCPKGLSYLRQELADPRRNLATSARVLGGSMPLVSVRLTGPIPKARIGEALAVIQALRLKAPIQSGQVLIENLNGLGTDVIATRQVPAAGSPEARR